MTTIDFGTEEAGAHVQQAPSPPTLLALFNWLGLGWWLLAFALLAALEYVDRQVLVWLVTIVSTPLFLGHCYLWDLRRRRRNE